MIKKVILTFSLLVNCCLSSEIIETNSIDDVRNYVNENTLCLFDIDDTLIDNPMNLGSPPWRNWAKNKLPKQELDFVLYDVLTLFIAKNAPYKTVEPATATLISDLQKQGLAVFAFTARGRSQWYTTDIEGVDRFTKEQLEGAGINFKETMIPEELKSLEQIYFSDGIIFAQHIKKGDLLKHLFKDLNYKPSLIIFVDDKLDQVQSVEEAVSEAGIPYIGIWYRRSEQDRKNFSPMATNLQLEALLRGEILSDADAIEQAQVIKAVPEEYFKFILEQIDINLLAPSLELSPK